MGKARETMSFIKWIDVLEAVQLLLEENAQPVSYTQMDSLTCGIYPLIPLSDMGFPSHTHLPTAISYYRCCPSPPCCFLPLTRNSDVGTSEQTGMAKGVWPKLACGLAQTQRKALAERTESGHQSHPALCDLGQRHAVQQSPFLQAPFSWCSLAARCTDRKGSNVNNEGQAP